MAINNTVMVTWANFHYLDFVMNWVQHVQATGCTAYLVGEHSESLRLFGICMFQGMTCGVPDRMISRVSITLG